MVNLLNRVSAERGAETLRCYVCSDGNAECGSVDLSESEVCG